MLRLPSRQTLTLIRYVFRSASFVVLLSSHLAIHAQGQLALPKANVPENSGFAQLDIGTVSQGTYHNAELGFQYQYPKGWAVNDKATQETALAAGRQFVWTDDTKRDHKSAGQCTKDLLFVTQYPEEMRPNGFNPLAFLIAADPKCAPGVVFPATVKDREAIQRIATNLGIYFKTPSVTHRGPAHIRAFDNAGRVILEISQSFTFYTHEPGTETLQTVSSSILVTQVRDYWIMWMFMGDSDAQLVQLRATKIFFDAAPTGPAQAK